jgi:hypothetical protein
LIVWRSAYSTFTAFLWVVDCAAARSSRDTQSLLVIMALKAISFLATQTNRPFAGFEGGEGASQTIWSMPNGRCQSSLRAGAKQQIGISSHLPGAKTKAPSSTSYQGKRRDTRSLQLTGDAGYRFADDEVGLAARRDRDQI